MSKSSAILVVRPIRYVDPLISYAALRGGALSVLLDSAGEGPDTGRYAIIAVDPVEVLRSDWSGAFAKLERGSGTRCRQAVAPNGWPFSPGLFGSLGYELRRAIEQVPSRHPAGGFPDDLLMGLFDTIVVFDLIGRRAAIIACDLRIDRPDPAERIAALLGRLAKESTLPPADWVEQARWSADHSEADYAAQVEKVLEYIRAGDIYQANFTQRWSPSGRPAACRRWSFIAGCGN